MNEECCWRPSASIELLRLRAQFLAQIRCFFNQRSYLEVETPIMAHHGITDVYLSNIKAIFRNKPYFLQTSPEYHMKRLLAAGSGAIFQIARVFRDDELGRWHNPEFSLLEWYQLAIDHQVLMDEVDLLLQETLNTEPMLRMTYQQAFLDACALEPLTASISECRKVLQKHDLDNVLAATEQDRDQYLFLLMSHIVEPFLAKTYQRPVAVYHFPPSQASLAQINNGVAERFEVYYRGVELANGFHELTDSQEQALRFAEDKALRQQQGFNLPESDPWLLAALSHGLPACSGVALGLDRLFALASNKTSIAEVMAFDFSRS